MILFKNNTPDDWINVINFSSKKVVYDPYFKDNIWSIKDIIAIINYDVGKSPNPYDQHGSLYLAFIQLNDFRKVYLNVMLDYSHVPKHGYSVVDINYNRLLTNISLNYKIRLRLI